MNNYLLQLLKEVKTIIIPNLGALTLTNEATGEMLFMNYLKYDDNTLTKHIAEKEGWSENDAKNLIAKFVREVQAELDKGHSYDMYEFGSFKKVDGEVVFVQWNKDSAASNDSQPEVAETATEVPDPIIVTSEEPIQPGGVDAEKIDPIVHETTQDEIVTAEATVSPAAATEEIKLTDHGFEVPEEATPEPPVPPIHEDPHPINAVPEITLHDSDELSPKMIVELEDMSKIPDAPEMVLETEIGTAPPTFTEEQKRKNVKVKPAVEQMKPDRKRTRPITYILWGIIVLILGGATYVAINFDSMKDKYPVLADLSGDSNVSKKRPNLDSIAAANGMADAPAAETIAAPVEVPEAELVDEATPIQPISEPAAPPAEPVAAPKPTPTPKPAPKPAPVAKPKPAPSPKPAPVRKPATRTPSGGSVASPDPSKPFHVIAGSFSSRANAESLARRLKAGGNSSTLVSEFNGMYRVSIASFSTREEALSANANYQGSVPGAWVFKWP